MQTDNKNCKPWPSTARRTAFSALAGALLLCTGTAHAEMYRWVDGNGRVHYSDTQPSTYQRSGGTELSKQGNVVRRTQSETERRAEAERQAEQKRVQQAVQKQAQLDRALTQTYTSEAEIDLARDRALEHHRLAINGASIRSKTVEANLRELGTRIASIEKAGRPVSPNLRDQLDQANRENLELKRVIFNNEEAMVQVSEKYAADKMRFRELTAK